MTLPSSGPLTLANIQTEFGGTNPIGLNEYYAGGGLVPSGASGTYGAVPSSGQISVRNFYGTANVVPPSYIGQAYGGGYYGGSINVGGTIYYLIVSDKSVGYSASLEYGVYGTASGSTNKSYGAGNSATAAAYGSPAASFCENLNSGGYTDWYLPSIYELQVLYYFLKPDTTSNITDPGVTYNYVYGMNPNAVSPQPVNTLYSSSVPGQTSATNFQAGANSQEFPTVDSQGVYLTSTEGNPGNTPATSAWTDPEYIASVVFFKNGYMYGTMKNSARRVRAIRRIAA